MYWKIKSAIQNTISLLPSEISYDVYCSLQRKFGGLRNINPTDKFIASMEVWNRILKQDQSPVGKVFLEVGTGRIPLMPIGYWLMGAEKIITIDVNPYLKRDLLAEALCYMLDHKDEIHSLFGDLIDQKRLQALLALVEFDRKTSVDEVLKLCQISYVAPGDAANTGLPDECIDYHTSYTVYEHIPNKLLEKIIKEGNRITKNSGLFIHCIDYSDHFSHSDKSISAINFLQYSDKEWDKYAGNRYMYMNRLRHDDFLDLFEGASQVVIAVDPNVDHRSEKMLKSNKIKLVEKFRLKQESVLIISSSWITSKKIAT